MKKLPDTMAESQYLNPLSVTTYAVIITTGILITRYLIRTKRERETIEAMGGRPLPGPWGVPLFGNMPSLDRSGPHLSLMKMAKEYGNIFKIQMGSRPVLVLNGLEAIQNALVKQSVVFAGRPDLFTFNLINQKNIYGPSLSFSTYTEQWKLHRKLAETSFRHFTAGSQVQFLEDVAKGEAEELVRHLRESKPDSDKDIRGLLRLSVSNIILWYMFSKRSSYDDQKLINMLNTVDRFTKATGSGNPVDFLPWMKMFFAKSTATFLKYRKLFSDILSEFIEEHYAAYEPGSERDIMDHLITTSQSSNRGKEELERLGLGGKTLLQTAYDLFGAGFETVSTTLEWTILYMAKYPQIQTDVQHEMEKVVGRDRLPTLNDRDNLPLTQSCLLEIQRHIPAIPFAIPHSTTTDTVLEGYYVPKDMTVFVNLYSAHFDPDVWDQPEVFDPRRFLAEDGTLDEEKRNLVIPFGLGRRRCLGSDLARINLFIYFTTFLHQLNFSSQDGKEVSLEYVYGLASRCKEFNVRVDPRS